MDFTTSDGAFTKLTTSTTATTPQNLYTQWCQDLNVSSTGSDAGNLDVDDSGFIIRATSGMPLRPSSEANRLGFASEGMIEIYKAFPNDAATNVGINIPNISRMYSTNSNVSRMAISFHPPYDAGSSGVKVRLTPQYMLMSGDIQRDGQIVSFAFKAKYREGFQLALKTSNGTATVPIYIFEIGANNSTISNQQQLASINQNDASTLIINGDYRYGTLSGTVIDEAGNPAQRKIRVYDRSMGTLLAETISNSDGTYSLPALINGEMYAVALDDDTPPSLNALIFDRITLD